MATTGLRRFFCWRPKAKPAGGFSRDDDGNTVVEFALVAPIFFALLLSIFEVSMMFGSSVLLDAAAANAARAVRTGQVYTNSLPDLNAGEQAEAFEAAMCNQLFLIKCEDLSYNVEVFTNFASANATVYCDTTGAISGSTVTAGRPSQANFNIGEPAQIVVLTVVYPYRPVIPNPLVYAGRDWKSAAEGGCNGLSMQSVVVFRNEPFPKTL